MERYILIGGAWPYANNSLHIGHISGLISGDILARYHRLRGDKVAYVSGTDCHGTPITETAKVEKITPREVCTKYHEEFVETFKLMEFSYDLYTKTDDEFHSKEVQKIFMKLKENGYVYEKIEPQPFCETCNKFLADRELKVICSQCGLLSNGEQCDCGHVQTVEELKNAVCAECDSKTVENDNKNLYFSLSKFQDDIQGHLKEKEDSWRKNVKNETEKYLREGLKDRAITRNLDWGISIPVEGYEDKRLYVWIDAVLGYVTATKKFIGDETWERFWKEAYSPKIYMIHGKDNIVFHSIILPALLMGQKEGFQAPYSMVSNEYLNMNDEKISKSKGNGLSVNDIIKKYNVDTVRYYLVKNSPEKKDGNFTIDDFEATFNADINNKFSNFVNRTLRFKGIDSIKAVNCDEEILKNIKEAYTEVAEKLENLEFRDALARVMKLVSDGNLYYDEQKPWIQKKENIEKFNEIMFTCTTIIANLSNLLEAFMPLSCAKLRKYLKIEKPSWELITLDNDIQLENIQPLFERLAKTENSSNKSNKDQLKNAEQDKTPENTEKTVADESNYATIDEFDKIKLRVATVVEAEKIKKSDKLLKLKIEVGGEFRQVVSGIAKFYQPDEMIGKKVVYFENLKPIKLRGVESQGMILAASNDKDELSLLSFDKDIDSGSEIS